MTCLRCQAELAANARFCSQCGLALPKQAASDSSGSQLNRLIPKAYADQLAATPGRVQSERRVVTMLFLDIVGSTALAEHLDPEEVVEFTNSAFEALVEPIHRFDGTVARFMGDALLALFGAPVAHEDDPIRACRAAREMLQASRNLSCSVASRFDLPGLAVRIGINTGLVVVGEVGSQDRVEYTAMGDAINLASRIEHLAEPDSIYIGEATYKLVGHTFDTEDRGLFEVRGRTESVRLFHLGEEQKRNPLLDPADLQAPLVGRQGEMASLADYMQKLTMRQGGLVTITGDAGIGKSRLLVEARRTLPLKSLWVETRFSSGSDGVANRPAADILLALLNLDRDSDPAHVGDTLYRELESLASVHTEGNDDTRTVHRSPNDWYPFLARLLDSPVESDVEKALNDLDPETLRRQAAGAFAEYLHRTALIRPFVLVIEDLHWADAPMLEMLAMVLPTALKSPLLIICTLRPDQNEAWQTHQRWQTDLGADYRVIDLDPLSHDESTRLAKALWKDEHLPANVLNQVVTRVDGNAFFLEEVLKSILDSPGSMASASELDFGRHLPSTVQGVIQTRIDALPPAHKQVLQTASVIGRVFPKQILTAMMADEPVACELEAALEHLCRKDLLQITASGDGFSRPFAQADKVVSATHFYKFKHILTAETTYESLLRAQRRLLHERAGVATEAVFDQPPADLAESLAYHFEIAGCVPKALAYLERAAERATHLYSHQKAIRLYRRAIDLIESETETSDYAEQASAVHERLGDLHYRMSDYVASASELDEALALDHRDVRRTRLSRKRGQVCEKWGRYGEARTHFDAALSAMGRDLDELEAAHAYSGLCLVHYHMNEPESALQLGELALDLMQRLGNLRGEAQALNNLGIVYIRMGKSERALRMLDKSLSAWQRTNDCYGLAMAHNNMGLAARDCGDTESAQAHFWHSLELFGRLGNSHGEARAYDNLSQLFADAGNLERASEYTSKAACILAEIGMTTSGPMPEMWQSGTW
jgi:class 3 adenylate cyclase/tetratricopeptide (TPR) repeat protein